MGLNKIDEMIGYFNRRVSEMPIARKYKMELLVMITAIGYEAQKQNEMLKPEISSPVPSPCTDVKNR